MAVNNPYEKMRTNMIQTATPEELTLMLYDGAVKFSNQAIIALENKDFVKTNELIKRVQDIIREFQLTLNRNYEISTNFASLYEYIYSCLFQANIEKNLSKLEEARDMIRDLRDTWKEAIKLARQQSV